MSPTLKTAKAPRSDWEEEARYWKRLYLALARDYVEATDAAFTLRDMLNDKHERELEAVELKLLG